MLKNSALLVVSLLLPSCFGNGPALSPEAKSVTLVHESDRPLHCKFLGKINANARDSDEKVARAGAEIEFRNQAAAMKANFALIEADRASYVGTSTQRDIFLGGKALLCQTEAMEEASDKAEEKKQADAEQADAASEEKAADAKADEAKANQQKPKKKGKP